METGFWIMQSVVLAADKIRKYESSLSGNRYESSAKSSVTGSTASQLVRV